MVPGELAPIMPPLLPSSRVLVRGVLPPDVVQSVRRYLKAAQERRTHRAYQDAWRAFCDWAVARGATGLPVSEALVLGYLSQMAERGSPVSSVRRARTVIRIAHRSRKLPDPTGAEVVVELLAGIEKTHGKQPKRQAAPFLLAHLQAARALFAPDAAPWPRRVQDWAKLTTAWFNALRRSEAAGLGIEDVKIDDAAMVLQLRDTKRKPSEVVSCPAQTDISLCPVIALRSWLLILGEERGPVFRPILNSGRIADGSASSESVNRLVKRVAEALELPGGPYSAHSLRAGLASELRRRGVPAEVAMQHTRHKSRDQFEQYVRAGGYWEDHPMYGLTELAKEKP